MINRPGLVVLLLALAAVGLLLHACPAVAADGDAPKLTCRDVRAVVALVGPAEAERMARAAGATDERIAWARRCLSK